MPHCRIAALPHRDPPLGPSTRCQRKFFRVPPEIQQGTRWCVEVLCGLVSYGVVWYGLLYTLGKWEMFNAFSKPALSRSFVMHLFIMYLWVFVATRNENSIHSPINNYEYIRISAPGLSSPRTTGATLDWVGITKVVTYPTMMDIWLWWWLFLCTTNCFIMHNWIGKC